MNDNHIVIIFVAGTLLLALFAFFLIAYLLVQKDKQNKFQLEKARITYWYQNEILRVRLEVQENAMDQISKEIHDNIGQLLSLAQMNMYAIADMVTAERDVRLVTNTNNLIGQVITDLQNLSHSLNSDFIKRLGLTEVLRKEIEYISLSKNISCTFEVAGDPVGLPPEKEVLIYRIAQEAIHNTLKHAKATKLDILLSYEPTKFVLTISDNGIGFELNKIHSSNGIGFTNMYQRAMYIEGTLDIQSAPQTGSKIILSIDITPK